MTQWFPAAESNAVVGRVVEIEKPHAAKSREAGYPVNIMVPVMETKVLKDSSDISHQELKPHIKGEFAKITGRFPGAWEAYVASKGTEEIKEQVLPPINGTPIEKAASFLPKERVGHLKLIGFSTIEQLAAMSDTQMQSLGPGARNWRKKAQQHLAGPPK